ncbi:MAG: winged helix-turn-helix domain-containing protein [Negativicutes bacterium]
MLESIITSKTRIQLLLRFFMNPERKAYLRELATEMGESSNGIRVELDRLEKAKLLESSRDGRTVSYRANTMHPLFGDIQNIVKKSVGIDRLIDDVINRLGEVKLAFITDDYARGIDSRVIDIVIVGRVDRAVLNKLIQMTEPKIGGRKIRALVLSDEEYEQIGKKMMSERACLVVVTGEMGRV